MTFDLAESTKRQDEQHRTPASPELGAASGERCETRQYGFSPLMSVGRYGEL